MRLACAITCALLGSTLALSARGAAEATGGGAGEGAAGKTIAEARTRFDRGVELHREGDFAAALVEFRRAYEIAPNFRLLYNIGQMSYQLHEYVAALDHLSRYLAEGGRDVPASRRREVVRTLRELSVRVGHLAIVVDEPNVEIIVDGASVGRSPLPAPMPVNVGRHAVRMIGRMGLSTAYVVDVPGDEAVVLRLVVPKPPAPPVVVEPEVPKPPVVSPPVVAVVAKPAEARRYTWIGWTAAGALAVGAGVAGWVALDAARDRDDLANTYPSSSVALEDARYRLRTAALAADGLAAGAALMAVVTLSWHWLGAPSAGKADRDGTLDLSVAPVNAGAAASLSGRF